MDALLLGIKARRFFGISLAEFVFSTISWSAGRSPPVPWVICEAQGELTDLEGS
jgi:hypothetical protein